jgi:hypothetical protein
MTCSSMGLLARAMAKWLALICIPALAFLSNHAHAQASLAAENAWKSLPSEERACIEQHLQEQHSSSIDVFIHSWHTLPSDLLFICRNTPQKQRQQLLANPIATLNADDQQSYKAKLVDFMQSNEAITLAVRANDMVAAAQTCTYLFGDSANCNDIFPSNISKKCSDVPASSVVSCALTSLQLNALIREEDTYIVTNFFLADNTEFKNWHCNVVDVVPPSGDHQMQLLHLPGRDQVTFLDGGQVICKFDFPNLPIVTKGEPPDFKLTIVLYVEDEKQLVALSKNEEITFDARAFCQQSREHVLPSDKRCVWSSMMFIAQRVTNKSE